jgi:hypothetical protein
VTWHDNAASAVAVDENGDTVAIIMREQQGGEKCRLYVKDGVLMDGVVFATLAKAKDAAEEAANV